MDVYEMRLANLEAKTQHLADGQMTLQDALSVGFRNLNGNIHEMAVHFLTQLPTNILLSFLLFFVSFWYWWAKRKVIYTMKY